MYKYVYKKDRKGDRCRPHSNRSTTEFELGRSINWLKEKIVYFGPKEANLIDD